MKSSLTYLAVFALALNLAGCASLPAMSSGKIGCPEEEITISNEKTGWNTKTWVATCKGKKHYCTFTDMGQGKSDVSCAPEQK